MLEYDYRADTRSLYIHWPFCPYKCQFCPFVALSGQDHHMAAYHAALKKEIIHFADCHTKKLSLDTIYIGGGTPSTWPDDLLLDMFDTLREKFLMNSIDEVTLEVNPGTVRKEQIALWKQAGITRLSIGVQSLDDTVLKSLNRHQKADDVRNLLMWTEGIFENVSVDIIIGLPGVSKSDWEYLLKELGSWPVSHVSLYFLTVHEETPLYRRVSTGELTLPPDDDIVDLYYWSVKQLKQSGFEQYEVSSFARSDYQAKHNQVYWDRKPYKGFGIGACSFDGKTRFQNEKSIVRYMQQQEKGESSTTYAEILTDKDIRLEQLMLGLRRMKGVVLEEAVFHLSPQEKQKFEIQLLDLEKQGYVRCSEGRLFLEAHALALENEIAVKLSF